MKLVPAALLLVAACAFVPDRADATTASELLQSCQAIATSTVARNDATLDIPPDGLPCWYFMSAVQNMTVLVDENGTRLLGVCPPPDSTVLDFIRVYVAYAGKKKGSGDNAAALALTGLAEAFPCR
jgi:hypothetical protein